MKNFQTMAMGIPIIKALALHKYISRYSSGSISIFPKSIYPLIIRSSQKLFQSGSFLMNSDILMSASQNIALRRKTSLTRFMAKLSSDLLNLSPGFNHAMAAHCPFNAEGSPNLIYQQIKCKTRRTIDPQLQEHIAGSEAPIIFFSLDFEVR